MKLSIIIPIYNEYKFLPQVLERIYNLNLNLEKEIIIIDDGSTDGTGEWIKKNLSNLYNIKFKYHNRNLGKGRAIRTGLSIADGDIIVIQDADLELNPEDLLNLLKPILEKKAEVVYGNRNLSINNPNLLYYLGNLFLSLLTGLLYRAKILDMETCYKMFKKEVMSNIRLKEDRFRFEPEVTAKILKKGYKIYQVPIRYSPRRRREGKKISLLDGIKAVWTLLKYRFVD